MCIQQVLCVRAQLHLHSMRLLTWLVLTIDSVIILCRTVGTRRRPCTVYRTIPRHPAGLFRACCSCRCCAACLLRIDRQRSNSADACCKRSLSDSTCTEMLSISFIIYPLIFPPPNNNNNTCENVISHMISYSAPKEPKTYHAQSVRACGFVQALRS